MSTDIIQVKPEIRCATVRQKRTLAATVKRRFIAYARVAFTISLLLFWYTIGRLVWRPYVVFQVYGTERDKRAYFTPWMEKVLPVSFPIAILRVGGRFGLVAGTMVTAEELDADPSRAITVVNSAKKQYGTRPIALAGRLPSLIHKSQAEVAYPAVEGAFGTRFAMARCAVALAERDGRPLDNLTFGTIGAGFIGAQVAVDLSSVFASIVSFDIRFDAQLSAVAGNVLETGNVDALKSVDVALVFTPKGDDAAPYAGYFSSHVHVADDTHPCMKRPTRQLYTDAGVTLLKAVTEATNSVVIFPRLPNFEATSVPGCLLEALVVAKHGRDCLDSFELFSKVAEETGFVPVLMPHPDDS